MNRVKKFVILILILGTSVNAQNKQTVAVMDLAVVGIDANISLVLSNLVRQELIKSERYNVVDRNNMESILKEQDFQLSDACNTSECVVEVGKVLGVEKMIFGTIGALGKKFLIDLQLIDVKSGRLEKAENTSHVGTLEDLDGPIRNISRSLAGISTAKSDEPLYKIYITSEPAGASVHIDDIEKGSTPLTISLTRNDPVKVSLKAQSYQNWFQEVQVRKDETVIVNAKLLKLAQGEGSSVENYKLRVVQYEQGSRSPIAAFGYSAMFGMFVPGAGHYHARDAKLGLLFSVIGYGSLYLAGKSGEVQTWLRIYILNYAVSTIDAPFAARRHNSRLKQKLGIALIPDLRNGSVNLALSLNF